MRETAPHRLGEGELLRAENRYGFSRKTSIQERGFQNPDDIFDGDGTNGSVADTDEGKGWKGVEGTAQVAEHVVAPAIDDSRFHDRVVDSS